MSEMLGILLKAAIAPTSIAAPSASRKNKNGRMPSNPTAAMSLLPLLLRDAGPAPLRLWTRDDTIHENVAVQAQPNPSKPHLMQLGVFTCGVSESLSDESASVAGTGYRNRRDFDLAGHSTLWTHVELSKRSSFQKRNDKKPGVSSNSNRLQVQQESDILQQSGDGLAIGTVAPNAHGKPGHYAYLRRAQRAGGPLVSQHAYGSPGELIYTDQVLWAPTDCDGTQLRIGELQPVCKHGHTQPHGACRFMQAYEVHEQFKVQDEHGGWIVIFDRHYSLCILGEKKESLAESTEPIAISDRNKRKYSSTDDPADATEHSDDRDDSSVTTVHSRSSSPQDSKRARTASASVVDAAPTAAVVVCATAPTPCFSLLPQPALMYSSQLVVNQKQHAETTSCVPSSFDPPLLKPPPRSPSVCADDTDTVDHTEETPPPSPERVSYKTASQPVLDGLPHALPTDELRLNLNFDAVVVAQVPSSSSPLFTSSAHQSTTHNLPGDQMPPSPLSALPPLGLDDLDDESNGRMEIDSAHFVSLAELMDLFDRHDNGVDDESDDDGGD